MKKGIFPICLLLVTLALTGVSCVSKPPVNDPKPPVQKQPDAVGTARVDESRKRAMDFDCHTYFPSDWEAVETRYADARNTNNSDEQVYSSITDSYDELFQKTVPLYAQAREDEIMAARGELISTGFTRILPGYLEDADKTALEALAQYEDGDYYRARDTAAIALNEYESLQIGAKVLRARQEIIDRDFVSYDPENFDKADEIAQTALDTYEAGDKETAFSLAEEALLRYNVVLQNAWTSYAAVRRASAASEREIAMENKANIASRDLFREADALFNQAEEEFKAEKFSDAGLLFIDSEALFVISSHDTDEKRQKALETIRLAEEKIEESVGTAIEAERIIEGGSK